LGRAACRDENSKEICQIDSPGFVFPSRANMKPAEASFPAENTTPKRNKYEAKLNKNRVIFKNL
jgi:hypothetical protein